MTREVWSLIRADWRTFGSLAVELLTIRTATR